jgi:hypothetical protein
MTTEHRDDWRPPTDRDWQRLMDLLDRVATRLRRNAEAFDQVERDLREIGGLAWSIGVGRYVDRAARTRALADQVEDELGALRGGQQRKIPLDDCGMFPGALMPLDVSPADLQRQAVPCAGNTLRKPACP